MASVDELAGWHRRYDANERGQTWGGGEGHRGLASGCACSHRVGHDWATEQQQSI